MPYIVCYIPDEEMIYIYFQWQNEQHFPYLFVKWKYKEAIKFHSLIFAMTMGRYDNNNNTMFIEAHSWGKIRWFTPLLS